MQLLALKLQGLEPDGVRVTMALEGGKEKYLASAVCYRCGEKGHLASACSKVCSECGIRCCRGASAMECSVHGSIMPTEATLLAGGKAYYPNQLQMLQMAWREAHKEAAPTAAAAAVEGKDAASGTVDVAAAEKQANMLEQEIERERYFERFLS